MTAYVTEICPSCGNLTSVCSDPEVAWYPQQSVCYATAAREQTSRALYDAHGTPDPTSQEPHFMDGKTVYVSVHDLTPDDSFGGALAVLPTEQPVGQQPEADEGEQNGS
jgi:hypothetical protein